MKTRRQLNEASFRKLRRKQAQIRGAQPERDKDYLAWIRMHPCIVCTRKCHQCVGRSYPTCCQGRGECVGVPVEAAHIGDTGRGMRQKCSDYETVPLCGIEHHREGPRSIHKIGRKAFEAFNGVDLLQIATALRKRFLEDQG